jgi:hypothetical protein
MFLSNHSVDSYRMYTHVVEDSLYLLFSIYVACNISVAFVLYIFFGNV